MCSRVSPRSVPVRVEKVSIHVHLNACKASFIKLLRCPLCLSGSKHVCALTDCVEHIHKGLVMVDAGTLSSSDCTLCLFSFGSVVDMH